MTPDELVSYYPVLHHMAEQDSWLRIQQIGLRTTAQLVDACAPDPATRNAILNQRRAESFELVHPVVGAITVRDQKPLKAHNLKLVDVTAEEFYRLLNSRVFMWATHERLARLLGARSYRSSVHDVLVLDTRSVVEAHAENIRLTCMNTGSTIFPSAPTRGAASFMTIEEFPFAPLRRRRRLQDTVVELCVVDGVDDIRDHVMRVERRQGATVVETIFQR